MLELDCCLDATVVVGSWHGSQTWHAQSTSSDAPLPQIAQIAHSEEMAKLPKSKVNWGWRRMKRGEKMMVMMHCCLARGCSPGIEHACVGR